MMSFPFVFLLMFTRTTKHVQSAIVHCTKFQKPCFILRKAKMHLVGDVRRALKLTVMAVKTSQRCTGGFDAGLFFSTVALRREEAG